MVIDYCADARLPITTIVEHGGISIMNASKRFAVMIENKNTNIWIVNIRDREKNMIIPVCITDNNDHANKRRISILDDLLMMDVESFKQKWLRGEVENE